MSSNFAILKKILKKLNWSKRIIESTVMQKTVTGFCSFLKVPYLYFLEIPIFESNFTVKTQHLEEICIQLKIGRLET